MDKNIALRTTFDEEAELYNKARPLYPEELFNELIEASHLPNDANLLEIGLGTGQATKPLAKRGYTITAVELGASLAEVARQELKPYPKVHVITSAFEDVNLPEATFDLVYAATAFHWIKPEIKFTKTHHLLKPNGCLAIIHTEHISDDNGDEFFKASQSIYDKYGEGDKTGRFRIPSLGGLKPTDIDNKLFENIYFKAFLLTNNYTAEQFTDLLSTYSPQRAMPEAKRQEFLSSIAKLINSKFSGTITRRFAMTLTIARRK